jgi:hypothetical protein
MSRDAGYEAAGAALGAGLGYGVNAIPHQFDWRRDHLPILHEPYHRPQRFYERWGLGYDEGEEERKGALAGALGGGLAGGLLAFAPRRWGGPAAEVVGHVTDVFV